MSKEKRRSSEEDWRRKLLKGDKAEIASWVEQSGLERVVRIVAVLADGRGEQGRQVKPDVLLMVQMMREDVTAAKVARTSGRTMVEPEHLASKVRREFKKNWAKVKWLARTRSGFSEPSSASEQRILSRIFEILPEALNLYDQLLADAAKRGPDELLVVQKAGRDKASKLLAERVREHMSGHTRWPQPRDLFDLIADDLRADPIGRK